MKVSLSARNIVKNYGGVVALSDGNLEVQSGEVLALLGANGSGKSTLSKVINGVVVLDGGQLLLNEKPVHFSSPQAAKEMGISIVFQELSLLPNMTVAENIWLTREPIKFAGIVNKKTITERTFELIRLFEGTTHGKIFPNTPVSDLAPDERQIVEILKAISFNPKIIILDEATASLDSRQVARLFELVRKWKQDGKAIIFVSHRMEEIFQIGDRYTVLRNGKTVGSGDIKQVDETDLVRMMIAEDSLFTFEWQEKQEQIQEQPVFLEVNNLSVNRLKDVSFHVRRGELLGIGGLQGQGQRELLLTIFGDHPYKGEIKIDGKVVKFRHPRQAMEKGVALVPGDRSKEGLLYIRSILENLILPSWKNYGFPLKMKQSKRDAERVSANLKLKMAGLAEPVSSLSGGNAQKVVIGKWLLRSPQLLLLDDPTKGVDVGTKTEFYTLLSRLCEQGKTILLYSSDDDELLGMCDRIIVMYDGKLHSELTGESLTKENLIGASLGVSQEVIND